MWKWPGPEVRVRVTTYGSFVLGCLVIMAVLFFDHEGRIGRVIYKFQTLIAGALALLAAWISLKGPRAQIVQVEKLEEERRVRNEASVRSMLPIALNEMSSFCEHCIGAVITHRRSTPSGKGPIPFPEFDRSLLPIFAEGVRAAPVVYSERLASLISQFQIVGAIGKSVTPTMPSYSILLRA